MSCHISLQTFPILADFIILETDATIMWWNYMSLFITDNSSRALYQKKSTVTNEKIQHASSWCFRAILSKFLTLLNHVDLQFWAGLQLLLLLTFLNDQSFPSAAFQGQSTRYFTSASCLKMTCLDMRESSILTRWPAQRESFLIMILSNLIFYSC